MAPPVSKHAKKKQPHVLSEEEEGDNDQSGFIKFPRTCHLFDTGNSVSRDDLIVDDRDAINLFFNNPHVVVEEKIDGSNLGLSIDPISFKILAQNRSHFVTSQSHAQFAQLDRWIDEHSAALFRILCDQPASDDPTENSSGEQIYSPRFVLFGEWMYARHTVSYDRLPGLFIAFDLFDLQHQRFLSVAERNRRLVANSDIPIIRPLVDSNFVARDRADYVRLLDQISHYSSTSKVEGLYLRLDEAQFLSHRAKIVRPQFIGANESHWATRANLVKNIVVYDQFT